MNITVMQAHFYFAVLIRTVHTLFLVLCSLTLRPTDAEAPSGHTQAGLRPGNVQELHGTAYPTPVLATNDGFSRAG